MGRDERRKTAAVVKKNFDKMIKRTEADFQRKHGCKNALDPKFKSGNTPPAVAGCGH